MSPPPSSATPPRPAAGAAGPSLRADLLAGATVVVATPERTPSVAPALTAGLTGYGARLVPLPPGQPAQVPHADLLLVDLRAVTEAEPATAVTDAFLAARRAQPALAAAGGAVVFLLPPVPSAANVDLAADRAALHAAVGSLARSLAQEWADHGIRANVLIDDGDAHRTVDLIAYMASPAAVMLTGQLLDLTGTTVD